MKIPFTWKTAWFVSSTRRSKLMDRGVVLSLFSITHSSQWQDGTTHVLYPEEVGFKLEESFLDDLRANKKVGAFTKSAFKLMPGASFDDIEHNYYVIEIDGYYYGLHATSDSFLAGITLGPNTKAPYSVKDWMVLRPGDIDNYPAAKEKIKETDGNVDPIVTTYGRYLVNYRVLCNSFEKNDKAVLGHELKYINQCWPIKKVEKELADLLIDDKITVSECDSFIDNSYYFGSLGEICGTCSSRRSLVPSNKILERKKELLHEHRKDLKDPRIMSIIETELINMDKAHMKGDPAMDFLDQDGKNFAIRRKRQFLSIGMLEDFGAEKGKYVFVPESLSECWSKEHAPAIINEARHGFYARAVETQVSGLDTKWMISVFQNCKIVEEDCQTKKCLELVIRPGTESSFLGRYVLTEKGVLVVLTKENLKDFINKTIKLRSVMYCQSKFGFCRTCAGEVFKKMNYDNISALPIDVGGVFTQMSMNAFHGGTVSLGEINDINSYII